MRTLLKFSLCLKTRRNGASMFIFLEEEVQTVQSGTPELYIWGLTLQQIALGLSVLAEGDSRDSLWHYCF